MSQETKDILEIISSFSGAIAAFFAAGGLFLNWWGVSKQTKAIDTQNTVAFLKELERYNEVMFNARNDPDKHVWEIRNWLNFNEMIAALYLEKSFENVTSRTVKDQLIYVSKKIQDEAYIREIYKNDRAQEKTAFEKLAEFIQKNQSEVDG